MQTIWGVRAAYESIFAIARRQVSGIRLASDMVPNHMGIDSTWVIEHPDWFISRPESPFPSYSFEGPDLSVGQPRGDQDRGSLLRPDGRSGGVSLRHHEQMADAICVSRQ